MKYLIKKYASFSLVIITAVVGFVFWKKHKNEPESKTTEADEILKGVSGTVARKEVLKMHALNIAHDLGTAYPIYDPRHWSENDKKVFDLVKLLQPNDFKTVGSLYFEVYAKGRDLKTDLAKLLDSKYYKELNF